MESYSVSENWINNCTNTRDLTNTITLLKQNNNNPQLIKHAESRLRQLNSNHMQSLSAPSEKGLKSAEKKERAKEHRLSGNECIKEKKWEEAAEFYSKSIALDPYEHTTYGNRALAHLKLKNYKEAVEDASRSIEIMPSFLKGYQRRADAWIELNEHKKAYRDVKVILEAEPNNSYTKNALARIMDKAKELSINLEEPANAQNKLSEVQEEDKTYSPAKEFPFCANVEETKSRKPAETMEDVYDLIESSSAGDLEEKFALASKRREAAEDFRQSMRYQEAILNYLQSLAYIQELKDEKSSYQRTVIHTGIAMCCKNLNDDDGAIEHANRAIWQARHSELLVEPLAVRAEARMAKAMFREAREDWARVDQLQPGNPEVLRAIEEISKQLEVQEQRNLINSMNEIRKILKEHKEEGNKQYKARNYLDAVDEYTKAIELLQERCNTNLLRHIPKADQTLICNLYNNRAICSHSLGRQLDAIDDTAFIINKLDDGNVKAWFRRGKALRNLGSCEGALADFQRVLELDSESQEARREYEEVCEIVGKARKNAVSSAEGEPEIFAKPQNAHDIETVWRVCKEDLKRFYGYLEECVDPGCFVNLFRNAEVSDDLASFIAGTLCQELQEYDCR
eukprot:TRINITY_DN11319_c0_g1_i4.p1 TRINITY_DN11319_c0_g1~~TRINITY_DN11319_c0_g1_i4.p1  ORF type:complete len:649 (-),score=151.75 TRINITY_DN11319_c0_g1_i4:333-2207(-)